MSTTTITKRKRRRLPNNLERLRIEEGIKRAQLARYASLSDRTLDRVEQGDPSTPETMHRILNALNKLRAARNKPYSFKEVFPNRTR
jgi:transcriptional regulator with XRE-family HTH domain